MNRIKRFIKAVDWKSTATIVAVFLFLTLSYALCIGFQFTTEKVAAIGFFWAWFVAWPIFEIWIESKAPDRDQ
ncbi:MAG: hypothetical protein K9G46_07055 [Flavobacteriales bacterium]|nr:hypothetical protein [Flavobacteriales bacterium]